MNQQEFFISYDLVDDENSSQDLVEHLRAMDAKPVQKSLWFYRHKRGLIDIDRLLQELTKLLKNKAKDRLIIIVPKGYNEKFTTEPLEKGGWVSRS